MKHPLRLWMVIAVALSLSALLSQCFGQAMYGRTPDGRPTIIPESSIPRAGRINTNYFIVGSGIPTAGPPPGAETPGSIACVYRLVQGPPGCPITTSTAVPTGGVGAIAIVDAGDYPNAVSDLAAFSTQFGLPQA